MTYRVRCYQALLFFLLGWQASGCIREEVVTLQGYGAASRPFIYGVLSPGQWIRIYIARTVPYGQAGLQPDDFEVDAAIVKLRDADGREIALRSDPDDAFIYQARQDAFPILPGQTYTLHVEVPGFDAVRAQTTVPAERADWKRLSLLAAGDSEYVVNGYWDAPANDQDYGYGVSYSFDDKAPIGHGNEGIANVAGGYTVHYGLYMGSQTAVRVLLLTRDRHFSAYSKVSELATDVALNYTNANFTEFISGFKGVFPYYSNIDGGAGVFGSFRVSSAMLYR